MGKLDAFNDAKFGLMISWGIYSVGGVEASWPLMLPQMWNASPSDAQYFGWATDFRPGQFAHDWVRHAQSSGARYLVPLTKHHDGFCMFDAPGVDFKSTNPAYGGRDFMAELAQACSDLGFANLGYYYSPPDLHNANYRDTTLPASANWWSDYVPPNPPIGPIGPVIVPNPRFEQYIATMKAHLETLLTDPKYRVDGAPVFVIWFDGLLRQWIFDPQAVHDMVATLSPETLTNNRLYLPGDFITPENFVPSGIPVKTGAPLPPPAEVDLAFLETLPILQALQSWPQFYDAFRLMQSFQPVLPAPAVTPANFQPWESCMTMTTLESWSYNPNETYKPVTMLVQMLAQTASSGGNFLLNVGPDPTGSIPAGAVATLEAIGTWLNVNGAAIYGTGFGPFRDDMRRLYTTQAGDTVYLHVFDPSLAVSAGRVDLLDFGPTVTSVEPLASGLGPLPFTQTEGTVSIDVSQVPFDPHDTVLALATTPR
jgi:alpha-L-fucosidase